MVGFPEQRKTSAVPVLPGLPSAATGASQMTVSPELQAKLTENLFNSANPGANFGRSNTEMVVKTLAATGVKLVDDIASSPINPMSWAGVESGDVQSMAQLMAPDLADKAFYQENQGMVDGLAGIVGIIGTATIGDKWLLKAANVALTRSTMLAGSTALSGVRGWEASAKLRVLAAQAEAVKAGEKFSILGTAAGRNYLLAKTATVTGQAARQEALAYAVFWNNEMINAEGWAEDAKWQAIGLLGGAAIGAVQARAVVRKALQSPEIGAIVDAQIPQLGYMREAAGGFQGPQAYMNASQQLGVLGVEFKPSVEATTYFIASRHEQAVNAAPGMKQKESLIQAQLKQAAADSVEKIFSLRMPHIDVVREPTAIMPEVKYLTETLAKADPYILQHNANLAIAPRNLDSALAERKVKMKKERIKAQNLAKNVDPVKQADGKKLLATLNRQENQQAAVLIHGTWHHPNSPLAKAAIEQASGLSDLQIIAHSDTVVAKSKSADFVIDASFTVRNRATAKGVDWLNLTPEARLTALEGINTFIRNYTHPKSKLVHVLDETKVGNDWMRLDMAADILEKGGKVSFAKGNKKLTSVEAIRRESLRIKAEAYVDAWLNKGKIITRYDDELLRHVLNLPSPTQMERLEDHTGQAFKHWILQAAKPEGTVKELSDGLRAARQINGLDLIPSSDRQSVNLTGDLFNWNRDDKNKFLRPLLGMFDTPNTTAIANKRVAEEAYQTAITHRYAMLMNPRSGAFVGSTASSLAMMPAFHAASKVSRLLEGMSTGLGNAVSQLVSEVLPQWFKHRDNPVITAAYAVRRYVTQQADSYFRELMKSSGLSDLATQVDTPAKAAMTAQLDAFTSFRPGWDLAEEAVGSGDSFMFELLDTAVNRKLLGVKKVEKGAVLMNPVTKQPLTVNQAALEALQSWGEVTDALIKEKNALRAAMGKPPLKKKSWYVPQRETKGAMVAFAFDVDNKLIPLKGIVAKSQAEYDAAYAKVMKELPPGSTIKTREQIAATRTAWDEMDMDWIDQGHSSATAGIGQQAGGLTSPFVISGRFRELLDWTRQQTTTLGDETIELMMLEDIKSARMRAQAEPNAKIGDAIGNRNIFDEYLQALTGYDYRYEQSSLLSKAVSQVERSIDKVLASAPVHVSMRHVIDVAHRFGVSPTALGHKKTFRAIQDELGANSPFKNITEYLESQGHSMPASVQRSAQMFNSLATNVVLRWDLIGHPIMNMLGLIPTVFAGVAAGKAPTSVILQGKNGAIPLIDSLSIVKRGLARFSKASHPRNQADWDYMVKSGDASQSSFEYRETLDSIKSQAGFLKWFDKADKWLGAASDGSENLSRQTAHFVGLEVADLHGITGMDARHAFAREFADAAIANYDPNNRPELMKTAFGSVFGLFQSYTISQYTKMFRWIEDGNYKAAGIQAALQASMFGLPGTYGASPIMSLFDSMGGQDTGEPNLMDSIYHRFGPQLGSVIAHGGISELSGIALWTRGDTTLRAPGFNGQLPPAIDVMTRLTKMMGSIVSDSLSTDPGSRQAMLEVIQREMPNRMLKGIMAVALLDGRESDRFGAVMSETEDAVLSDFSTWVDSLARIGGLRSTRMQKELEVYYANKASTERDAVRREDLRLRFRAAIRESEKTGKPISAEEYFNDYVASGGNPASFRSFVRDSFEHATTVRSAEVLKRSLATPANQLQLWRMKAYGALPE